ncbi:MAG: hypothetical protein Q7T33_11920 [Dehalococcoidia bacterium]|nr:hypothetical protein [Dehalococcoidia bacterium]
MDKKLTVEFRDKEVYNDLMEIAGLCKEAPEELLVRAFREWVQLREDLEDTRIAEERIAEYERTGESIPHEQVMKKLGLKKTPTR